MEKKDKQIEVKITFTLGYEKRFTAAILKICKHRERKNWENIEASKTIHSRKE